MGAPAGGKGSKGGKAPTPQTPSASTGKGGRGVVEPTQTKPVEQPAREVCGPEHLSSE